MLQRTTRSTLTDTLVPYTTLFRSTFINMAVETGAMSNWYGFNVKLAANILREAAAMTTQITGQVIPSDVPGSFAMALRQPCGVVLGRSEEHTSELQSLMRISYAVFCLQKKKTHIRKQLITNT